LDKPFKVKHEVEKMNKKTVFWKPVILILILSVMTLSIRTKQAHAQTSIYIDPVTNTAEPSGTFTVNLMVAGVPDPGAALWDVYLKFDSSVLRIENPDTDIVEGDWLGQGGLLDTYFKGTVGALYTYITSYLKVPGSTSGDGWMASITFKVIGPGNTTLDIYNTQLKTEDEAPIPHEAVDGSFYTDTPKADFVYSYADSTIRSPVVGETITFNATRNPAIGRGSYDPNPGGAITSYIWDFGDGSSPETYTTGVATHTYMLQGDYQVNLTVMDNSGPPPKTNTQIQNLHISLRDIAISSLEITPAVAAPGSIISINVTVANLGTEAEYFNVTLYYDSTLIPYNLTEGKTAFSLPLENGPDGRPPAPALLPTQSLEIAYKWNTTGITEAQYTIKANASLVIGSGQFSQFMENAENNYANNQKQGTAIVTSSPINIAITNIIVSKTVIAVGQSPILINVTIQNQGILDETFSLSVFYDSTLIENRSDVQLSPLSNVTLTFIWDTANLPKGIYHLKANASQVPNEMLPDDNIRTYSGNIIVSDSPVANFTYTPATPQVGGTITFDASSSSDPDGIIQDYSWDFGDGTSPKSGKTATHAYLTAQDFNVTLTVTDNATLKSKITKQLTIDKANSQITIEVSQATINYGSSITITGAITPTRAEVDVTIVFGIQGEQTLENLAVKKTNSSGYYTHVWTPPAAKTYRLRAMWPGDSNTHFNLSSFVIVTVNKATSIITLTASPTTITVGSNVVMVGKITPTRASVTVTIQIRPTGGIESTAGTVVTDTTGSYTFNWTSHEKGTYEFRATWNGDDNTVGSQSSWSSVTVTPVDTSPPMSIYYIAAGIVIIAVITIALFYFLKMRKP